MNFLKSPFIQIFGVQITPMLILIILAVYLLLVRRG